MEDLKTVKCSDCKHLRFDAFTGALLPGCAVKKVSGLYGDPPSPLIILNPSKPRVCSEFEEEQPVAQEK